MKLQFVIEKATGKIKRWGYCDFANDGTLDANTEEVVTSKDGLHPHKNTKRENVVYDKADDKIKDFVEKA